MAKATDLTARIHIVLEIDRPGPEMEQLAEGVHKVQVRIAEVNQVQNTYRTTVQSTTGSVRYLLLNLRMFSFGIRTLRRQFGDTNPIMEAFSSGLLTLAAVGSTLVSASQILKYSIAALGPVVSGLTFGLGALVGTAKVAIGVLGLTTGGIAAVLLSLIAIPAAAYFMEGASGIRALRQEAKSLESDLKTLEGQLKSLRAEQEKFNLGMAVTDLELRKLKRALDLAGGSNEALESRIKALTAERENASIANDEANIIMREGQIIMTETKAMNDDLLRQENAIRMVRASRGMVRRETLLEAMRREDTTGRPSMGAMQEAMTAGRERGPAGLGRAMGGPAGIVINFPNAIFNTEGDIEGALQSGAEKAGRIIYNQYGVPGRQR